MENNENWRELGRFKGIDTVRLENVDALELLYDGNYYCVDATNVPTVEKTGFVRVICGDDNHTVVYWRPHNSNEEYSNVKDDGEWLGWHKILTEPVAI